MPTHMEEKLKFLEYLRTFVGTEGMTTVDQAVQSLGSSRNTIGNHLKAFNAMLGCEVTEKGVAKTKAGERIEPDAERMLAELEASLDAAKSHLRRLAQPSFPVQVALSPTIWMWGAEGQLLPLTHSLPKGNAVEFLVANSDRVERVVLDGWFEIGVIAHDPSVELNPALERRVFCEDEILLAVPPGHEWSRRKEIPAAELTERGMIVLNPTANARRVVDHALAQESLELAEPHEEVAMAVVAFDEAAGAGVPALVSALAFESPRGRAAAKEGFSVCRVSGLDLSRRFHVIYRSALRPEATAVMETLSALVGPKRKKKIRAG